jgi:hypothetical protein
VLAAAPSNGDEPIGAGGGEVVLAGIAGVGQGRLDGDVGPSAGGGAVGGGPFGGGDHRLELLHVAGVLPDRGGDDQLIVGDRDLQVVALHPAAPGGINRDPGSVRLARAGPAAAAFPACRRVCSAARAARARPTSTSTG